MKSIMLISTSLVILFGALAASSVSAEQPQPPSFEAIDTNADLYIDKQEFEQIGAKMREAHKERFGGGRFAGGKRRSERMEQLYNDADADGDSLLNEYEFAALQEKMQSMREQMRERWKGKREQD